MSGLIDNVRDFARGRLGGGVAIVRNSEEPFEPVLREVVGELQAIWPQRTIETHFEVQDPFDCDRGRLAQLLSNLLGSKMCNFRPLLKISWSASGVRGTTLSCDN
jgi:sigma-B regulation protein RsbU (phosphoserine phosphatase)